MDNSTDSGAMFSSNGRFGPPTTMDIVVAPVVVMVAIVIGNLLLSFFTQPRWWCCQKKSSVANGVIIADNCSSSGGSTIVPCKDGRTRLFIREDSGIQSHSGSCCSQENILPNDPPDRKAITSGDLPILITPIDGKMIDKFNSFQNNPLALFKISTPVLVSLIFCPVTILLYQPLGDFFWPKEETGGMPVINDVVSAFLMPAGLVYAIAFGFAYQDVLGKRNEMSQSIDRQLTLMRQIWQLANCGLLLQASDIIYVAKALKRITLKCMADIMEMDDRSVNCTASPLEVLTKLREIKCQQTSTSSDNTGAQYFDGKICDMLMTHLVELDSSLTNKCHKDKRNINILQWLFLELLGFITFFGIIMIKANSYRLELTMCMLTVFTISAFSYILADLDSAFHGTFRITLEPYSDFLLGLEQDCKKRCLLVCDDAVSKNGMNL